MSENVVVVENVGVGAARFFQGIGEERQAVEGTILVDAFC